MSLFSKNQETKLKLKKATSYKTGVVQTKYKLITS